MIPLKIGALSRALYIFDICMPPDLSICAHAARTCHIWGMRHICEPVLVQGHGKEVYQAVTRTQQRAGATG